MANCFMSEIRMVGFTFSPVNWSACNGALMPISQNSALFALMGTYYGGDGRVTMGLPNLIGRAPMHYGFSTGPGQPFYHLGEKGGLETVVMNHTNLPVHKHEIYATTSFTGKVDTPSASTYLSSGDGLSNPFINPGTTSNQKLTALEMLKTNGSNQAAPNQQPFLVTNFIIALDGTFPARN